MITIVHDGQEIELEDLEHARWALDAVQMSMEDREDTIAIFDAEGSCKGLWQRELEGHVDSAGDTIVDHDGYELRRPGGRSPKTFAMAVAQLQKAA